MVIILLIGLATLNYNIWNAACPPLKQVIKERLTQSPPQGLFGIGILLHSIPVLVTASVDNTFTLILVLPGAKRGCPISGSEWGFFIPVKLMNPADLGQPV